MNPRIEKLKTERKKLASRIDSLQKRLENTDEQILKLENTDIVGIVRENGITIDQLAELLQLLEQDPTAEIPKEAEEPADEI